MNQVKLVPYDGFDFKVFLNGERIGTLGVGFENDPKRIKERCSYHFNLHECTHEFTIDGKPV